MTSMSKTNLLDKAKGESKRGLFYQGLSQDFTPEQIGLAVAYARNEVSLSAVKAALNQKYAGPVYLFLARALAQYVRSLT